jgi:hypothetical protein
LADYHEQVLFTDPDVDGIGNIAAHTMIPPIIDALESISNASKALKLQYIGVAYKPVGLGVFEDLARAYFVRCSTSLRHFST